MVRKSAKKQNKAIGYAAIVAAFLIAFSAATWAFFDSRTPKYDAAADGAVLLQDIKMVKTDKPSDKLAAYITDVVEGKSGCPADTPGKTHFRGELGDFALINYGCGETDASMYLTKRAANGKPSARRINSTPASRCVRTSKTTTSRAHYIRWAASNSAPTRAARSPAQSSSRRNINSCIAKRPHLSCGRFYV